MHTLRILLDYLGMTQAELSQYTGVMHRDFCDTPKGAEASAVVYSLVESDKANGIEPFAYLQHVLVQLPYFGKFPSHEELETLMPCIMVPRK